MPPSTGTSEASLVLKLPPMDESSAPGAYTSGLCSRCYQINFEKIFSLRIPSTSTSSQNEGIPIIDLGKSPLQLDYRCSMCRFITLSESYRRASTSQRSGQALDLNQNWHLRAFDASSVVDWACRRSQCMEFGVILALCPGVPRCQRQSPVQGSIYLNNFLLPAYRKEHELVRSEALQGKVIDQSAVDFKFLQRVVEDCLKTHKCSYVKHIDLPRSTRVIDCQTREIISLPDGAEFITLSYVWGHNKPTEEESRFVRTAKMLPLIVPQTVADAMIVVEQLNRRYIWIDRYCIDQFHSSQKAEQIASMADIFENAVFTIVALGKDATSGLPGISRSRSRPLTFEKRQRQFVFSGLPLQYHLDRSAWSTRAWVYQEAILSNRCLFFSDEQAFFVCRVGVVCETIPKLASYHRRRSHWHHCRLNPPMLGNIGRFDELFREYKTRQMTMDSDSLNAFKGILNRSGYRSWWGVPFCERGAECSIPPPNGLMRGLLWHQEHRPGHCKRRAGFPSWSWACTNSTDVQLEVPRSLSRGFTRIYADQVFTGERFRANSLVSFKASAQQTKTPLLPETTKHLDVRSFTVQLSFSQRDLDRLLCRGERSITLAAIPSTAGGLIVRRMHSGVSGYYSFNDFFCDYEAKTDLESVVAGQAKLKAVLLCASLETPVYSLKRARFELRSKKWVDMAHAADWMVVCCTPNEVATRVGIMKTEIGDYDKLNTELFCWEQVSIA